MHHTKNDLPEKTRANVIGLFQACLSGGLDLVLQSKHAHWNVKGPNFIALHKLFDKVHGELEEAADLIAERIEQLGGIAFGTLQETARRTTLPTYPATILDSQEHVEALSHALAAYGESVRRGISQADEWGDAGSADILTQISRSLDKNLWFVESHLPVRKASAEKAEKNVKGVA